MSRKTIIVGNWKMNKTPTEAKAFLDEFAKLYKENKDKIAEDMKFGIAAPSIDLQILADNKVCSCMIVAAENFHQKDSGAYTGELSADMIKAVGADAVVIGHSERREYFNESDKDVNEKTKTALQKGLLPIVCVGETLEQYEKGLTKEVVKSQIERGLEGIDSSKVIIAYEPIWAIGTGKTATSEIAQEVCKFIRTLVSNETIIQYGGSVKPENIAELMSQPDIDGALVGGASLDASSFLKLLTLNK